MKRPQCGSASPGGSTARPLQLSAASVKLVNSLLKGHLAKVIRKVSDTGGDAETENTPFCGWSAFVRVLGGCLCLKSLLLSNRLERWAGYVAEAEGAGVT